MVGDFVVIRVIVEVNSDLHSPQSNSEGGKPSSVRVIVEVEYYLHNPQCHR